MYTKQEIILSVSRKKVVSFDESYAFDSTTMTLFSQVMQGWGRNPKSEGKGKGGLKVHMLTDVHTETAVFAKIVTDLKFEAVKFWE